MPLSRRTGARPAGHAQANSPTVPAAVASAPARPRPAGWRTRRRAGGCRGRPWPAGSRRPAGASSHSSAVGRRPARARAPRPGRRPARRRPGRTRPRTRSRRAGVAGQQGLVEEPGRPVDGEQDRAGQQRADHAAASLGDLVRWAASTIQPSPFRRAGQSCSFVPTRRKTTAWSRPRPTIDGSDRHHRRSAGRRRVYRPDGQHGPPDQGRAVDLAEGPGVGRVLAVVAHDPEVVRLDPHLRQVRSTVLGRR